MEWLPIESAPKDTPIHVWGYNVIGHGSKGGPYKHYVATVGELDLAGICNDLLRPGCDCLRQHTIDNPTHWMPLPPPPKEE